MAMWSFVMLILLMYQFMHVTVAYENLEKSNALLGFLGRISLA